MNCWAEVLFLMLTLYAGTGYQHFRLFLLYILMILCLALNSTGGVQETCGDGTLGCGWRMDSILEVCLNWNNSVSPSSSRKLEPILFLLGGLWWNLCYHSQNKAVKLLKKFWVGISRGLCYPVRLYCHCVHLLILSLEPIQQIILKLFLMNVVHVLHSLIMQTFTREGNQLSSKTCGNDPYAIQPRWSECQGRHCITSYNQRFE